MHAQASDYEAIQSVAVAVRAMRLMLSGTYMYFKFPLGV